MGRLSWKFCLASPLILFGVLFLFIWLFLGSTLLVHLTHAVLMLAAALETQRLELLGLAFGAPLCVHLVRLASPYPRWQRWLCVAAVSSVETYLLHRWVGSVRVWLAVAVFAAWLLLVNESWHPTALSELEKAEEALLAAQGVRSSHRIVAGLSTLEILGRVEPGEAGGAVHTAQGTASRPVIVMCHGYASGKALLASMFPVLSSHFKVYALDWRGFGRSDRSHKFPHKDTDGTIEYFLSSLEDWRQEMRIEKMALFGHSMGGYLVGLYTLRYPDHVSHLFLGSPVGLPQITPRNELPRWLSVLWDAGVTPISLIRALGPAGPCLVRQVSRLRWGHVLNPEQLKATASYIWHVNAGPPCADIAIVRLLRAGAWPRKAIAPLLIRLQVPVTFLYGDLDWMGYHHSLPVVDGIHGQYQRYSPASEHTALLTANKPEAARVYIVEQADHQLFMTAGEQIANALIHDFERLTLSADKFAQAKIKTLARANADRVVIHNMIGERNASTAPLPNVTPPAFAGSADAVSGQERMAAAGNAFICEPLHNVHGALFLLPSQGPPLPPSHHRHNRRDFERR